MATLQFPWYINSSLQIGHIADDGMMLDILVCEIVQLQLFLGNRLRNNWKDFALLVKRVKVPNWISETFQLFTQCLKTTVYYVSCILNFFFRVLYINYPAFCAKIFPHHSENFSLSLVCIIHTVSLASRITSGNAQIISKL